MDLKCGVGQERPSWCGADATYLTGEDAYVIRAALDRLKACAPARSDSSATEIRIQTLVKNLEQVKDAKVHLTELAVEVRKNFDHFAFTEDDLEVVEEEIRRARQVGRPPPLTSQPHEVDAFSTPVSPEIPLSLSRN